MPKKLNWLLLTAYCLLLTANTADSPPAFAQAANGTYALTQETLLAAGGLTGQTTAVHAKTCLGLGASAAASNSLFSLEECLDSIAARPEAPITSTLTVTGTVDDPSAAVTVNQSAAVVTGTTFSAVITILAGPNTITATATDSTGNQASRSILVYLDYPASKKTPRFDITVQGTFTEIGTSVSVNNQLASLSGQTFTASVQLVNGLNIITVTATDSAGNQATRSVRVFVPLPTLPPPMPTVGTAGFALPQVTTQSSITLGGTKTKGTSIWINGVAVVAANDELTWSVLRSLIEGDNTLIIVAKDAAGVSSAEVNRNVILDNQPPVISFAPGQPPAKTNFNPFSLQGTVDDSLTEVWVNDNPVARSQRNFQISLPLVLGQNAIHITARSPNGFAAVPVDRTIVLGTVPAITAVNPSAAVKLYAQRLMTVTVTAVDQEQDPIQYRLLLDGNPLGSWGSANTLTWTPSLTDLGFKSLTVEVKDDFGGSNKQDEESFVIHAPVQHP